MMSTLEEFKKIWDEKQSAAPAPYELASLEKIIRSRVNSHTRASLQYFWASFVFQVLVYSLLSHVVITYWQDAALRDTSMGGILLYLPFTILLMRKFKRLAASKPSPGGNAGSPLYDYALNQQTLLRSFYNFKKGYELFLIPLIVAIGVFITFKLYVPGGTEQHLPATMLTFLLAFVACVIAIRTENKKSFKEPIQQLQNILNEFREEDG